MFLFIPINQYALQNHNDGLGLKEAEPIFHPLSTKRKVLMADICHISRSDFGFGVVVIGIFGINYCFVTQNHTLSAEDIWWISPTWPRDIPYLQKICLIVSRWHVLFCLSNFEYTLFSTFSEYKLALLLWWRNGGDGH